MGRVSSTRKAAVRGTLKGLRTSTAKAESALEWFYTRGQCLFERSASGGQLDALMRASAAKRRCPRCCSARRKIAADCSESRNHLIDREAALFWGFTPGILPDGKPCPTCSATGWVEVPINSVDNGELTARPNGHEVKNHGYQVEDGLIAKYAQVTRWLREVGHRNARVLESYYGNDACRCAMVDPWSTLLAVMPLTDSGQQIIARARMIPGVEINPIEQVRVQAILQQSTPLPWRAELLERAYREAKSLLEAALAEFARVMTCPNGCEIG